MYKIHLVGNSLQYFNKKSEKQWNLYNFIKSSFNQWK
jgi:hypothetical protein